MKKIAFFISSLTGGGAERVVSRSSYALKGIADVVIFVIDGEKRVYETDCPVIDLGAGKKGYYAKALSAVLNINKYINELSIDCIISYLDIPNLINAFIIKGCDQYLSIRNLHHKDNAKSRKDQLKNHLRGLAYKSGKKVIFASKQQSVIMGDLYGIKEKDYVVIENPYDLKEIENACKEELPKDIEDFIKAHKTSVAVGRFTRQKGFEYLLKTFAKVKKNIDDAGLIICGDGSKETIKSLRDLSIELGIEKDVLMTGWVKNPLSIIKRAGIFISTSLWEGFPNGLVEAMATGACVLHTDCMTGPKEILMEDYDPKDGYTNESGNVKYTKAGILLPDLLHTKDMDKAIGDMEKAWEEILTDPERRKMLGIGARDRAAYYSYEKYADKIKELIDKC